MPYALLLSPDEQAVTAITGVLEELSVTCERPMDGAAAAQKINSRNFDLVLVDCENLPAAKLIFDVCRRGKNGHNPVPVAIVDGRAGLPTAFRLGAELILTKPVSKDQARTTIRTAVGRVRKDPAAGDAAAQPEPACAASFAASSPLGLPSVEGKAGGLNKPELSPHVSPDFSSHFSPDFPKEEQAKAAAASASSMLTSYADPAPAFAPAASASAPAAQEIPAPVASAAPAPAVEAPSSSLPSSAAGKADLRSVDFLSYSSPGLSNSTRTPAPAVVAPKLPEKISEDPVMAELEMAEIEEAARAEAQEKLVSESPEPVKEEASQPVLSDTPFFSAYQQNAKKSHGAMIAVLALVVVVTGTYAAWMYQPGFRKFAQPQVDKLLSLAGTVLAPAQSPAAAKAQPKPAPAPAPAAVPATAGAPAAGTEQALASAAPETTSSATPANTAAVPGASAQTAPAPAASQPAPAQSAAPAPVAAPAQVPAATRSESARIAANPKSDAPKAEAPKAEAKGDLKKLDLSPSATDKPLPGEDSYIILSSKGAEKRLAHSVPPAYPASAKAVDSATVVLKEVVDEEGKVQGVRLVDGNATLAKTAMQAVKQWRYRPYVRDGKPQPFQTVVIVDFQKP